jgi:hypothetical protein
MSPPPGLSWDYSRPTTSQTDSRGTITVRLSLLHPSEADFVNIGIYIWSSLRMHLDLQMGETLLLRVRTVSSDYKFARAPTLHGHILYAAAFSLAGRCVAPASPDCATCGMGRWGCSLRGHLRVIPRTLALLHLWQMADKISVGIMGEAIHVRNAQRGVFRGHDTHIVADILVNILPRWPLDGLNHPCLGYTDGCVISEPFQGDIKRARYHFLVRLCQDFLTGQGIFGIYRQFELFGGHWKGIQITAGVTSTSFSPGGVHCIGQLLGTSVELSRLRSRLITRVQRDPKSGHFIPIDWSVSQQATHIGWF